MPAAQPSPRHLPPLAALRAFDAAARHLSISRAADELHLTHGAISHQVKKLEEQLGTALLARHGRGVVLTSAGAAFAHSLRAALVQLEQAVQAASAQSTPAAPLRISTLPSLAARWLVPRLPRFHAQHPGVDLHLHTGTELVTLGADGHALALRYGGGNWRGVVAEKLMDEQIVPVASPALLARHGLSVATAASTEAIASIPASLLAGPLLCDTHAPWSRWFAAMAMTLPAPANTLIYSDSGLLVQAAVAGQGVALVRAVLARDELACGRLVRLPGAALPAGQAYYAVQAAGAPLSPAGLAFLDWIRAEACLLKSPSA